MIGTRIIKAARAVPERLVTNDELAGMVDTSDEWIYSRTGIKNRRVSTGETASSLAADVFRQLTGSPGYMPEDIDLLIVTSVTPDYLTPHVSALVLRETGAKNAFAFDINAACTGFVYALSVADKMLRSGVYKKAVVISADTLSKIVDWSDRATCVLFGDGAAGVLLEGVPGEPGVIAEDLHSDGESAMVLRGRRLPLKNAWYSDDTPEEPYVVMDGHAVYDFTVREVPKSIRRVLEKGGLGMDEVKFVIPHQANARMIEVIARKLKSGMDKFYVNIYEYGNTTAASIPIALSELMEQGRVERGDKLVISGFGGGLTWGTILFQL